MECPRFYGAAGATWEEKAAEACTACEKCGGNFPINPDDAGETGTEPDVEYLVSEVASIIAEQDAGYSFETEPELFDLIVCWRSAEKEVKARQAAKLLQLLGHQNEILKAGLHVKTQ